MLFTKKDPDYILAARLRDCTLGYFNFISLFDPRDDHIMSSGASSDP